jgi:RNA polymerase sigma-70 factor (ECF subfamily)
MDQEAFRSFFDKTMPALRAYVIQCSRTVDIADDIVQEAFVRFLKTAPPTLSESQMRAYLYRTVENLIVNRWHRVQREHRIMVDAANNPLPQRLSEMDAMTNDMTKALSRLDPKQRSLLWLAYVEGFDHKEIAAAANVKEKSVRVLLFRARSTLLGILKSAGIGLEDRKDL